MADISSGVVGEIVASRFLREKGYDVLTANYRCRFGEIDIIARDGDYIVFVEVKTRGENAIFTPREAVTLSKQKKLLKTASFFMQAHKTKLQPRFDVIEVYASALSPLQPKEIDHIQNAFEAGDLHAAF